MNTNERDSLAAAAAAGAISPGAPSALLIRRDDQLRLQFTFQNLTLDKSVAGAPVLRRMQPSQPAFVIIGFPPQHLAEEVFREPAPPGTLGASDPNNAASSDATKWPAGGRLAGQSVVGQSRLAFSLPAGANALPFTADSLLQWGQLALSVAPGALARGAALPVPLPPVQAPLSNQTAIELPWRLILSPHAGAGFAHALGPVTRSGRTELWHTRLGVAGAGGTVDERTASGRTLRAVWGADSDFAAWLLPANAPGAKAPPAGGQIPAPGLPFRMAMTPKNRVEIVRATSDYTIPGFVADPVDAERLMLSSLGGWLDVRGAWNPPAGTLAIQEWRHRTTLGRDQNVRVVERGYLMPFGHAASVVAVTERKLGTTPGGNQAAYLRQRLFLVVRRPVKEYAAFAQDSGGRRFPFRRLTITTTTTPTLDDRTAFVAQLSGAAFVPRVGGAPYEFHFVAEDLLGRRSEFTAPAVFVDASIAFNESATATVRAAYNALPAGDLLRRRSFNGQSLTLADSGNSGDTDAEVSTITFAADAPAAGHPDSAFTAHDQPRFHPALAGAGIRLAAAEQLSSAALGPVDVALDPTYVAHGFDLASNPGQVYARLETPVGLSLDNDRAGPMTPGMSIVALSRSLGPVGGDLEALRQGTYDAPAILSAAPTTPRILGGVKLSDIIPAVPLSGGQAPDGAMVLTSKKSNGSSNGAALQLRSPHGLAAAPDDNFGFGTRFTFRPKPVGDPYGFLEFFDYTFCQIDLEISFDYGSSEQPHTKFQGWLANAPPWGLISDLPDPTETGPWVGKKPAFVLRLMGDYAVIEVEFIRFVMIFETGKDSYVNPVIGEVRFNGSLKFIDDIRKAISSPTPPGMPKPDKIFSLSPSSLEVGVKCVFPAIPCGVLTLKNIMVGVSVLIPFKTLGADDMSSATGSRAVRFQFRFAERENPFCLAVYCFGGGGYILMGIGTDGIEFLEIAFEFGIHAEGSIGIASGLLEIMAGIYLQIQHGPGPAGGTLDVALTGYFRARGQVSVIGIVTVTLEMYLGLTYQSEGNKVTGQATLSLEVDVLFFSMSVSFHVERQFGGDSQPSGAVAASRSALRLGASAAADDQIVPGEQGLGFLDQIPSQEVWNDYADAFAPVGA